jgi:hypothetical protein
MGVLCAKSFQAKSSHPHLEAKYELEHVEQEDAQMHGVKAQQHPMLDIFL